ncbi:MAG: CaiB/BaiF CoA-transferase family protein [Sulfuricaulis sp.]|nr:CaiB/BaiF CoA-transferase family protein [Sulfuricaulis sp.]
MGSLEGIRVVEMAGLGPAPLCGMLLADMGAEVIRVDRLGEADLGIKRNPKYDVPSRGKRSVAIDLKQAPGLKAVQRLIKQADVVLEGFRPGVMERLGLGPDDCLAANPGLIFGRITGWGQNGPLAQAAGHDLNYIALTGALEAMGEANGPPIAPLNLVGDFGGGSMFLALGITSALVERSRSGRGQVVDAAIIDGVSNLMAGIHGQHAGGYWQAHRGEHILGGAAPWNTVYQTSDDKYITLCAIEVRFYATLLAKLGLDPASLPDRMDRQHWPALRKLFQGIFSTRTRQEWCALLEGTDACFAPVLSLVEMATHPHIAERQVLQTVDGVLQPAPAPRMSRTPSRIRSGAILKAGEHSDAVLSDWGFSPEEVAGLRSAGAVA